jgi:Sulfotransferase domain
LRQDTENLLLSIVEFLGMDADRNAIQQAIANNTVDRMRAKEDASKVVVRGPGEEGRFVRRGSVGGWRERLNPMQLERIEQYAGGMLARLKYPSYKSASQRTIARGKARASAG